MIFLFRTGMNASVHNEDNPAQLIEVHKEFFDLDGNQWRVRTAFGLTLTVGL